MFAVLLKFTARLLFIVALAVSFSAAGRAASDAEAIKSVIEGQLNAFAADDGQTAYSYASPIVKGVFADPDTFMAMVKKGYQPVYRNSARTFGDLFEDGLGRPAMRVVLMGADGKRYEALYSMEKQQDGSWKIAGCVILSIPAQDV